MYYFLIGMKALALLSMYTHDFLSEAVNLLCARGGDLATT
jgi:hypothetical protein